MTTFPSLFLAHGAPNLPISDHPAKHFLLRLAARLPKPKAILIVSAHWETEAPTIGTAAAPETIYDFGGFEPELYSLRYPAKTDSAVVARIDAALAEAGLELSHDSDRGYDHGVWVPMMLAYPNADVPVIAVSMERSRIASRHLTIGRALAPLREEGILIIGSGAVVHNLRKLSPEGSVPPRWASDFDDWVNEGVEAMDVETLTQFPAAPETATQAHPTPEHLMPLFVAMGAGGDEAIGRRIHHSFSYGSISMASFAFGQEQDVEALLR